MLWLVFVAPITIRYLEPVLSRAAGQGVSLLSKHRETRVLFGQNTHQPVWEHYAAIGASVVFSGFAYRP